MARTLWRLRVPWDDLCSGAALGAVGQRGAGFGVGRLDVGAGNARVGDEDDDQQRDDRGCLEIAEAETADVLRLAEVVGEGGADGPGDDVGEPEGEDLV